MSIQCCIDCRNPDCERLKANEAERDSLKARVIELTNELIAKEAWASRLCAESVLAEREACAKLFDGREDHDEVDAWAAGRIRSRGGP